MEQLVYKRIVQGEHSSYAFLYYVVEKKEKYGIMVRSIRGDGKQRWATGNSWFRDYMECLRLLNRLFQYQVGPAGLEDAIKTLWE